MKKLNSYLTLFVLLTALIPAALPESSVHAQGNETEIIQPDGTSGYDTYIADNNATTNYGTADTMKVGNIAGDANWSNVDDISTSIAYSPAFTAYNDASEYNGTTKCDNTSGAYYSFSATTTGFHLYSGKSNNLGIVEVFIDNVSDGTYDLYNVSAQYQQLIYSVEDLDPGVHTIKVTRTGTKNASSSDYFACLDYIAYSTSGDTYRGLITWDLSTLPPDAGVVNATLSIWVAEDNATNASTLQAFVLKHGWEEEEATWAQFDATPYDYWDVPGAWGDADRELSSSGEATLTATEAVGTRIDIILSPDIITNMIRDNYFGIMLRTQGETDDAYSFYTSDYATDPDLRPMLTLDYDPAPAVQDPGWLCVDGLVTCAPLLNPAVPVSPFLYYTSGQEAINTSFGGAFEGYNPEMGAVINCDVYPLCKDDYPIYYRIEYRVEWTSSGSQVADTLANITLTMPGADNAAGTAKACGTGTSGYCTGVLQGEIAPETIPTSAQAMDFGLKTQFTFSTGFPTSATASWRMYLSYAPYTESCADTYMVPSVDTYTIDPTLETPAGMIGDETPADEQGYPTVIDQIYYVRVQNGPWNDGTDDRYDTAVSTDGSTYISLEEFAMGANVLCKEVDFLNQDLLTIYFTATTETFFIRVNDTAAAFADNTNNVFTPLQYVIGLAFLLTQESPCENQFELGDTLASITLPSTSEGSPVNNEMTDVIVPGGWYGIEVASGTWHETGASDERIDLEFQFEKSGLGGTDWADLADGSHLVYCESNDHKIVYVQATGVDGLTLMLRVNDQDNPENWADNVGTLGINVYVADFTRAPNDCELNYNVGDFIVHDTVAANATAGKMFAFMLASNDPGGTIMTGSLTPGAIYILDTTDGPWWQTYTGGGYNENEYYYDVKVKTLLGEWSTLADWTESLCVVDLDALGHQRVIFQVPDTGGVEYYIKVGGASPVGRGEMGWNLYTGYDNGLTGDDCSSFVYDPEQLNPPGGYVYSAEENGQHISGLEVDQYYAIEILASAEAEDAPDYRKSGWWENVSADESDSLQITSDGGAHWDVLPAGTLCYYNKPVSGDLVVFIKVSNGQDWKLRADSTTFTDNFGDETYKVFTATGDGLDPWITCQQDYTATVPALNEFQWIPPQDEEGVMLLPELTYSEEIDTNGDGIIWWENLWLMPDHTYMVATQEGPWTDGESPTSRYDAELSSDNGETWYSFSDHPDVICSTQDQLGWYWTAIFTVTEGQKWKIRVADAGTSTFTDNGGHLAYKLNLVNEFPIDCISCYSDGTDGESFDACALTQVKPEALTLSEIGSLGNYIGDWIQYTSRSMLSYFAWCQRHTDAIVAGLNLLKTREPLASVEEMDTIVNNVKVDVQSYDWDNGGTGGFSGAPEDLSIFDFGNDNGGQGSQSSSSGVNTIFEQYIMPQNGKPFDVWDGGDVVDLSTQTGLPEYYYSCNTVFTDYLPSRIRTGVCFVSAYWKETGASFWIQLLLDIGTISLIFMTLKGSVQSLVYMMTGVRPWTKDGAIKVIETTVQGGDIVQPVDQWRSSRRR